MTTLPQNIAIDFTDEQITPAAGSLFVSRVAHELGLVESLRGSVRLKQRQRGASDADTMMSMIACLSAGDGYLSDVDRLREDSAQLRIWGLSKVPDSRRLGEFLRRFGPEDLSKLGGVAHELARRVLPEVISSCRRRYGFVPVFMDGTALEVDGAYIEGARPGYDGSRQLWLHNLFIGPLWVGHRLLPGGVDVADRWSELLEDAADLLQDESDVWVRMDNAYYNKDIVAFCRSKGWDYSISVTNAKFKAPVLRNASNLWSECWADVSDDGAEKAALARHRPQGWKQLESYVVIRSEWDGTQRLLTPRHTVILVSRRDLPYDELIRRHRGKQGQENAQKGPLIELDLHHPPCLSLNANRAFYLLGHMAQNLLVAAQYLLLPDEARVHGLHAVLRDLVRVAGRLVRHARQWTLKLSKNAHRLDWLIHAADRADAQNPRFFPGQSQTLGAVFTGALSFCDLGKRNDKKNL
jgi:Transposase DDE domain group 1